MGTTSVTVSWNLCKHQHMEDTIIYFAKEYDCDDYYSDYECFSSTSFEHQRNHQVMTVRFTQNKNGLNSFIQKMKKIKEISIETIFEEDELRIQGQR